jgi:hypothetical protein
MNVAKTAANAASKQTGNSRNAGYKQDGSNVVPDMSAKAAWEARL